MEFYSGSKFFLRYPASSMSEVKGVPSITGHVGKKVAFVEIGQV